MPAVSGPDADALVVQLRSLMEGKTHPVLDNASGPAVAQADSSTVGLSLPGEPPPGPCQRLPAEEAAEVFLVLLR